VAEALDLFRAEGVEVRLDEFVGGYLCLAAVLRGDADVGTVADLPLVFAAFERRDFRVLATFVESEEDIKLVAHAARGVDSVADLRGRRAGAVLGSSSQFFLDSVLVLHGVDPAEVEVVGVAPERMRAALLDGEVDAAAAWEPYAHEMLSTPGLPVARLDSFAPYRETFNLVAAGTVARTRHAALSGVLRAVRAATGFMHANPDEGLRIVAERLGVDRAMLGAVMPGMRFGLGLDQGLVVTLENEARWAQSRELVPAGARPNFLDFIDGAALRALDPNLVNLLN
ncbi:MAG: ABC transporter substrate-binding protein, partial [Planctomycetes bacterium]|nr:ABC transporter substrate-binding protein [Planctomycetota bacterium]